jgi:hypothetical protein
MGQVEDAASEQLGEPVEAAALILPVGGWTGGGLWEMGKKLFRRSKGEAAPTVRLEAHNVLAVTSTRVACFGAAFARGEGLVPRDLLAEFPRDQVQTESERMEVTNYPSNPAGAVDASSKRIHRLALSCGDELLRGDMGDDGAGRRVMKALRGG